MCVCVCVHVAALGAVQSRECVHTYRGEQMLQSLPTTFAQSSRRHSLKTRSSSEPKRESEVGTKCACGARLTTNQHHTRTCSRDAFFFRHRSQGLLYTRFLGFHWFKVRPQRPPTLLPNLNFPRAPYSCVQKRSKQTMKNKNSTQSLDHISHTLGYVIFLNTLPGKSIPKGMGFSKICYSESPCPRVWDF